MQDTSFPPRVRWPIRARLRAAGVLDSEAMADLAKPVRPDVETLRLAVETADDVLASAAAGGDFWVTVEVGRTTSLTIEEPPLRDLRDFLVVLRTFDMPSSDIQLVKLYRIIEGLGPRRAAGSRPRWWASDRVNTPVDSPTGMGALAGRRSDPS